MHDENILSKIPKLNLVPAIEAMNDVENAVRSLYEEPSLELSLVPSITIYACNSVFEKYYKKFDRCCSRCPSAAECIKNKINKRLRGE